MLMATHRKGNETFNATLMQQEAKANGYQIAFVLNCTLCFDKILMLSCVSNTTLISFYSFAYSVFAVQSQVSQRWSVKRRSCATRPITSTLSLRSSAAPLRRSCNSKQPQRKKNWRKPLQQLQPQLRPHQQQRRLSV